MSALEFAPCSGKLHRCSRSAMNGMHVGQDPNSMPTMAGPSFEDWDDGGRAQFSGGSRA